MDDSAHNKANWYSLVAHVNILNRTHLLAECQYNSYYGAGCPNECGHCLNGEKCDPVTGTCNNGCEAGYTTMMCKKGKYNTTTYTVVS